MPTDGGEPDARKRDCKPGAVKHALSTPLLLLAVAFMSEVSSRVRLGCNSHPWGTKRRIWLCEKVRFRFRLWGLGLSVEGSVAVEKDL